MTNNLENFQAQCSTFSLLVKYIGPLLKNSDTKFRLTIPVEKRVCFAFYLLDSSSEVQTVGNVFGTEKGTVGEVLHEFCTIIIEVYFCRIIRFPTSEEEIKDTTNELLDKFNSPMCLGVLNGIYFSIKPSLRLESNCYRHKKFYSVIMLAEVNSNLQFTYINVAAPGQ